MTPNRVVAWMRDDGFDGSISTMTVCCSDRVKQIWLKANPSQVERYTIPLYAATPDPSEALRQCEAALSVNSLAERCAGCVAIARSSAFHESNALRAEAKVESLKRHVRVLQMLAKGQHSPVDWQRFCGEVDAIDAVITDKATA